MLADGAVPPTVAVMIDQQDRLNELFLNPTFADYVAQELVPWARRKYHLIASPQDAIIGGLSLGGLAASFYGPAPPRSVRQCSLKVGVISVQTGLQRRADPPVRETDKATDPFLPRSWTDGGE